MLSECWSSYKSSRDLNVPSEGLFVCFRMATPVYTKKRLEALQAENCFSQVTPPWSGPVASDLGGWECAGQALGLSAGQF